MNSHSIFCHLVEYFSVWCKWTKMAHDNNRTVGMSIFPILIFSTKSVKIYFALTL